MSENYVSQSGVTGASDAEARRDQTAVLASRPTEQVMDLLAEHVPLALLADLAAPSGDLSTAILESEGLPEVAWWEKPDEQKSCSATA